MLSNRRPTPDARPALTVPLWPRAVGQTLALVIALVVVVGTVVTLNGHDRGGWVSNGIVKRLALDGEISLARMVEGGALVAAAGLSLVCAALAPRRHALRWRWGLLAVVLVTLAADEMAQVHTAITPDLSALAAGWGAGPGLQAVAWLLVVGPLGVVVGLLWLPGLRQLPGRTRWFIVAAGVAYVVAAAGGNLLSAELALTAGPNSLAYAAAKTVAEILEMGAQALLVFALLDYLAQTYRAALRLELRAPPGEPAPGVIYLQPGRVALWLGLGAGLFAALFVGLFLLIPLPALSPSALGLMGRLHMDTETSLSTAYNDFLLALATGLLVVLSQHAYRHHDPLRRRWLALTAAFAALTLDEFMSLHERLVNPIRNLLGVSGLLGFGWYLAILPLVALLGLFCLDLVRRLPRRTQTLLVLAGGVYVGAAAGVEMFGALFAEAYGYQSLPYLAEVAVEETFEMLGLVVFIYALLDYVARTWGAVGVELQARPENV